MWNKQKLGVLNSLIICKHSEYRDTFKRLSFNTKFLNAFLHWNLNCETQEQKCYAHLFNKAGFFMSTSIQQLHLMIRFFTIWDSTTPHNLQHEIQNSSQFFAWKKVLFFPNYNFGLVVSWVCESCNQINSSSQLPLSTNKNKKQNSIQSRLWLCHNR